MIPSHHLQLNTRSNELFTTLRRLRRPLGATEGSTAAVEGMGTLSPAMSVYMTNRGVVNKKGSGYKREKTEEVLVS